MRAARAESSRSRTFFSALSGPGRFMLLNFEPFTAIWQGNEESTTGSCCFARLEIKSARAAEVSYCIVVQERLNVPYAGIWAEVTAIECAIVEGCDNITQKKARG